MCLLSQRLEEWCPQCQSPVPLGSMSLQVPRPFDLRVAASSRAPTQLCFCCKPDQLGRRGRAAWAQAMVWSTFAWFHLPRFHVPLLCYTSPWRADGSCCLWFPSPNSMVPVASSLGSRLPVGSCRTPARQGKAEMAWSQGRTASQSHRLHEVRGVPTEWCAC